MFSISASISSGYASVNSSLTVSRVADASHAVAGAWFRPNDRFQSALLLSPNMLTEGSDVLHSRRSVQNVRAAFGRVGKPDGGGGTRAATALTTAAAAAAGAHGGGGCSLATPRTPRVQSSPRHFFCPAPRINFEGGDIELSSSLKKKRAAAPATLKEPQYFAARGVYATRSMRNVTGGVVAKSNKRVVRMGDVATSKMCFGTVQMMKSRKRWESSSPVEIESASKRRRVDVARAAAFDARRHVRRATPGFTSEGHPDAASFSKMSDIEINALFREHANSVLMEERMRVQQKERAARKLVSEENSLEGFDESELETFDAIVLSLLLAWTRDKPRVTFDDVLKCVNDQWGKGVIGRDKLRRLLRARQFFYRVFLQRVLVCSDFSFFLEARKYARRLLLFSRK